MNQNERLNKMIKVALLGAIAGLLMFIEFPIIPMFAWLKFDFSELPVLMGAFAFGPIVGIAVEVIKIAIHFLISGTQTGGVGELANLIMGLAFILPASIIYHRKKSKKTAIIGMVIATVVINIVAVVTNFYLLLPLFHMTLKGSAALKYIFIGLVPINTLKAVSVSILTYLLYKRLSVTIFKVDHEFGSKKKEVRE